MTAKQMFAVLVKGMGFWCWVVALENLGAGMLVFFPQIMFHPRPTYAESLTSNPFVLSFTAAFTWKLLLGCILFFGAYRIASLFCREGAHGQGAGG